MQHRDLHERMLWRLPTPSPDFFLVETSLEPVLVDRIREDDARRVPRSASLWTEVTPMLSAASAAPLSSRIRRPFVSTL